MIHPESRNSIDKILLFAVALAAGVGAWVLATRLPTAVLEGSNPDIYFSSDASRVQANMVTRNSDHWRTGVHPLFSLELHSAFVVVATLMGVTLDDNPTSPEAIAVTRVVSGLAGALAAALFFGLLRTVKVRRLDAVIFTALAAVSASSIYWFAIPETYPWGSITILLGLLVAAIGSFRTTSIGWHVVTSVLTLSVTTTNWMVGILAMWSRFPWKKTVVCTGIALGIAIALALVQKKIFPTAWMFVRPWGEARYVMQQDSGGPTRAITSFFAHTLVMPEVTGHPHSREAGKFVLRTQFSAPGSASLAGKVALGCWALLLAGGIFALFTLHDLRPFRLTLGLTLLGQLALHTIYGSETFLYAAHYGPPLVILAALLTLTRYRTPALAVASVMIVCLCLNNFPQFAATLKMIRSYCPV